ncbi:hypothetical protein LCGC14_1356960 [marine sediment metagenome]|uniref:Fibronectin type-III domain-containing protein n=1 Tax=marine sediment metagenome TaxID=412755 RepID=A0A0F9K970_9ZZZZ
MPPNDGTLAWKPVALAGGLHDSKPIPEPEDLQDLTNWTLFRGRFALRGPLAETVQLMDDGVPTAVTSVLAIEYHVAKCYVVAHSTVTNKTYLFRLKLTGLAEDEAATETPITTIWTGATVPQVSMVSFEGGSATLPKQRLYFTDATGTYSPRYWDSTSSAMVDVEEDFNDDGTKESLDFPLIFEYNDHLFGTDFRQSGAFQLGLLRFSQPGLIPADEPGVTNNIQREWWNTDFKQIGSRGDKIIAASDAGAAKILFKRRRVYAFQGFDVSSWVLRLIAGGESLGAVGPHAASALPDGTCLFWSDKGPQLTDGGRIIDIGEMIKRRVVAVTVDTDISVEYSPDEGLCYAVVPDDGAGPYIYYAWDVAARRWVGEGSWKATGGSNLRVRDLRAISDDALPGPAAAPTGTTVTVVSDVALTANWTNGDTALNTVTDVHRDTSSSFTPGPGNLIDTVASGVVSYADTGRDPKTTYYYQMIHRRNGQSSAASNEINGRTALATPTGCTAETLVNGIRVKVTNNQDGLPDLAIEHRPPADTFRLLTTLVNQTTGEKTHDDTAATCDLEYDYRVRCIDAGETNSPYSNEATATACQTEIDITSVTHYATLGEVSNCWSVPNVLVQWSGVGFSSGDTAKVYRNSDRGGYVLRATVPITDGSYEDTWGFAVGAQPRYLQYKVEGWENGTVLKDTEVSVESVEDTEECGPEE